MENKIKWQVIDQDLAHSFFCETASARDELKEVIELMGHNVIVKEVK